MKNEENIYIADDMKLIIRKSDGSVMGDCIILDENDSINNYEEKEYSLEELKVLFPIKYNLDNGI